MPRASAAHRGASIIGAGALAFGAAALLLTVVDAAAAATVWTVAAADGRVERPAAARDRDRRLRSRASARRARRRGRPAGTGGSRCGRRCALRCVARRRRRRLDPARAWTTIATGQPAERARRARPRDAAGRRRPGQPRDRGPSSLGAQRLRGATDLLRLTRPSIASGDERRAKTFWEVAADAGLRTAVVNWWATWPATADTGVVLSDRATLRLERGGPLDAEIAPASLYEPLRQRWPEIYGAARGARRRRAARCARRRRRRAHSCGARRSSTRCSSSCSTGGRRARTPIWRSSTCPGLDIAQHALLGDDQARLAPRRWPRGSTRCRPTTSMLDRLLATAARAGAATSS